MKFVSFWVGGSLTFRIAFLALTRKSAKSAEGGSAKEWPGVERGLRIPIFGLPEGAILDPEEKRSL